MQYRYLYIKQYKHVDKIIKLLFIIIVESSIDFLK